MAKKISLCLFLLILCIYPGKNIVAQEVDYQEIMPPVLEHASAKVIGVKEEKADTSIAQSLGGAPTVQKVKIKIETGSYKGKIIEIENQLSSNPAYDIKVKENDKVLLDIEPLSKENTVFYISDFYRIPAIIIVFSLFILSLLAISGKKGIKSIISIFSTFTLIVMVLIPSIINKMPLIPLTIGVSILAAILSISAVGGLNLKSFSAILGTVSGLLAAGLIAVFSLKYGYLTGFHDNEALILQTVHPDLNFKGLLASSMLISSLGAIMDIGISIASSIYEIHQASPKATFKQLFKSGMNIGSDITGAMANTLILAYVGGGLPLAILAYKIPVIKLLSLNSIATEIFSALAGSIGIVLCVPATAAISAFFYTKKKSKPLSNLELMKNNDLNKEINS